VGFGVGEYAVHMIRTMVAEPLKRGARCLVLVVMCDLAGTYVTAGDEARSHDPAISCAQKRCSVTLPSDVREEISSKFPGFTPYEQTCFPEYYSGDYRFSSRQAMFAVVADFNGDGRSDVALLGRQGKNELFIGVVSSGQRYQAFLIESSPSPAECGSLEMFLTYAAPGSHQEFEGRRFRIDNAGVELIYDEKAAELYFWRDGKFQSYNTGD
jgi:hypothetical protein